MLASESGRQSVRSSKRDIRGAVVKLYAWPGFHQLQRVTSGRTPVPRCTDSHVAVIIRGQPIYGEVRIDTC